MTACHGIGVADPAFWVSVAASANIRCPLSRRIRAANAFPVVPSGLGWWE
jgi:hypothetical protein